MREEVVEKGLVTPKKEEIYNEYVKRISANGYKARIHNLKNPKAGAITVVQRFGDEVFFAIVPTHEEVVQLNSTLKKRLLGLLKKFEDEDHGHNDQSDFQAQSVLLDQD